MAEQIPTAIQEELSIDYFKTFLDNNWDVSDSKYRKLLSDSFGRNGKFSFAINFPSTPVGLRNREEWKDSFEKQSLGLQQFMISRDFPFSGWKWSRGNGMMGFLNGIAQQRCGVSTLDTWNPMDIVAVQSRMEQTIKNEIEKDIINGVDKDINRDLLNGIMIKYVKSKDLMPISLKKINSNERGAFEESDNLKGPGSKRKHKLDLTYSEIMCDLEWSTYKNEWKNAQEVSFTMTQKSSVAKAGVVIRVQARAFQGKNSREKPQHSLAQQGAGAMLGKTSIADLEKFVTDYKVSKVLSPTDHPKIPAKGKLWTKQDKDYWISRYNSLKSISIDGKKINFNRPGSYGEGMRSNTITDDRGRKLTGFAAALESACKADEEDSRVKGDPSRVSGSRLTAKLWGMEWLWRYYNMSMRGTWDAFCYRMIKASKKELSDTGPFIKILGEQGRSRAQKRLRMQQLIEDDPNMKPIYDPALANKKGIIPEGKKKVSNIVGYESDDPLWDKLLGDIQEGEMRGLKKNTST
jgi:hypothetical protein